MATLAFKYIPLRKRYSILNNIISHIIYSIRFIEAIHQSMPLKLFRLITNEWMNGVVDHLVHI